MFIVNSFNADLRYTNYWEEYIIPTIEESGISVELIKPKRPVTMYNGMWGDLIHKNATFEAIFDVRFGKRLKAGSKFLFTDSYSTVPIQLRMVSDIFGYDFEMYGIWNSGVYNPSSFIRHKYLGKNKSWIHNFEKSVFYSMNENWYPIPKDAKRFIDMSGQISKKYVDYIGIPIGKLKDVQVDTSLKENIILFPFDSKSSEESRLIEIFSEFFKDYEFVVCYTKKFTRNIYTDLLRRAKIILSVNMYDDTPLILYDAMKHGCIPIMPDIKLYSSLLNQEFLYPKDIIKPPRLNFVRNAWKIEEKFENFLVNYEKGFNLMNENILSLESEYFNDSKLISKLIEINDREYK